MPTRSLPRFAIRPAAIPALLALLMSLCAQAGAAPTAELWQRWTAHDAGSTLTVDHSAWTRLLEAHVSRGADGVNRVDYAGLRERSRARLDGYLDRLAAVPVSRHRRDEQLAYWVNLYNALTVQVIVEHYPVASIRDIDISPGLFANGPWGKKLVTVEGERLSLDDIEHRILRPIWRDPRIHYAVNCASIGCPDLMPEAFTAANSDRLMELGARRYVNHPRGVSIDDGKLMVSSIYDWFKTDFGGSDETLIAHLRRYAEPALAEQLASITRVADDRYDWSLNDSR